MCPILMGLILVGISGNLDDIEPSEPSEPSEPNESNAIQNHHL